MRGVPHALIGAGCGGLLAAVGGADPTAAVLASAAGALLPDIDHPGSLAGRALWPFSAGVHAVFGHRGATHSLLAVLCVAAGLLFVGLPQALAAAVAVGWLSHLLADGLTLAGEPLLWPYGCLFRLTPRWLRFRSGSWVEWPIALLVVAFGLWWVWV